MSQFEHHVASIFWRFNMIECFDTTILSVPFYSSGTYILKHLLLSELERCLRLLCFRIKYISIHVLNSLACTAPHHFVFRPAAHFAPAAVDAVELVETISIAGAAHLPVAAETARFSHAAAFQVICVATDVAAAIWNLHRFCIVRSIQPIRVLLTCNATLKIAVCLSAHELVLAVVIRVAVAFAARAARIVWERGATVVLGALGTAAAARSRKGAVGVAAN
jgi:hypothetical protein